MAHTINDKLSGYFNSEGMSEEQLYDTSTFIDNIRKNPIAAVVDLGLSTADKLGAPTNATNYIRDINANSSTKLVGLIGRGVGAIADLITGTKNKADDYANATEAFVDKYNPFLISPIVVRNNNYSDDEKDIIR